MNARSEAIGDTFYFWFHGEKLHCIGRDFLTGFPPIPNILCTDKHSLV